MKLVPNQKGGLPTTDAQPNNSASSIFENQHGLLTKRELATLLRFSSSNVNKQMKEGGLPYYRVGRAVRFSWMEVMAWLERRRQA